MEDDPKKHLIDAVAVLMKPLARLLISNGVTHGDVTDVLKDVFVDSVIRHFDSSPKINRSQIAVMTGLTRKEVKRVIDRAITEGTPHRVMSRLERVLSGWHNDPTYAGPYGVPLDLPYESDKGGPSFSQLVRTYGSDMSPKATLEELKRGGSVEDMGGLVKVLRREFHPAALSLELITRLGEVAHKFLSTATHNVEKKKQGDGYFDRVVYAENGCTDDVIGRFDQYIRDKGQSFLEDLDRWFAANEPLNKKNEARKETGLYMVHYVEAPGERSSLAELLRERGVVSD
ncbi:MAG: DUF6502 family protein [Pseudomonadota bacterium]